MNFKILTSYHLKNIALLTMLIDHIGCVFFEEIILFRIIGRISFILYAFLLVNGSVYTSNMLKYIKKLFFWAIISEIPYDLVFNHAFFSFKSQNIFFSLLIGALGIYFYKMIKNIMLRASVFSLGIFIAYILKLDYSWYGVTLIYGLYIFRNYELLKFGFLQGLSTFYAIYMLSILQFFSFLSIMPIYFYNGKRGVKTGNIYYSYYALHLLFLYIVKSLK